MAEFDTSKPETSSVIQGVGKNHRPEPSGGIPLKKPEEKENIFVIDSDLSSWVYQMSVVLLQKESIGIPLWSEKLSFLSVMFNPNVCGRRVMSLSLVPMKTCLAGGAMHVKSVEAQTSSHWCGVVVKREGASSGVILVT
ncbi:hypothetical protein TNCV_103351 [Trichonephila clavipes]|nr:hypothetical protein TNCV_103351 [Trichonephila clavipes]